MSLSSVECVDVLPTTSHENITIDTLCTLIVLLYRSVGGRCWIPPDGNTSMVNNNLGYWLSVSLWTQPFFPLLSHFFLQLLYPPLLPPIMPLFAMAYDQVSFLSVHSNTSFSFFDSCVKSNGFASSLHNSWLIWNLVPNVPEHFWVTFEMINEDHLHTTEPLK